MSKENPLYISAMNQALRLAEKGFFHTAPNPCVGAVLIKDEKVVASGYHKECGQAHAEAECLDDARDKGIDTNGATLVVTLEPCNHQGKTPPCSEAIINAGIKKVVIGMSDPNTRAAGGADRLRAAGLEVVEGVLEDKCRTLLNDFLVWVLKKRPFVILKMATTLDGKIALENDLPYDITGKDARVSLAKLRADMGFANGLVLVGGNTFRVDNPHLTSRGIACVRQPRAGVITRRLPSVDDHYNILDDRIRETIFLTSKEEADTYNANLLKEKGAKIYGLDYTENPVKLDIANFLPTLFQEENVFYILCEGGARLASSLFNQQCVDQYRQLIAPTIFNSINSVNVLDNHRTSQPLDLKLDRLNYHGDDIELIYTPQYTK